MILFLSLYSTTSSRKRTLCQLLLCGRPQWQEARTRGFHAWSRYVAFFSSSSSVVDPLQGIYKAEIVECFPYGNKEDPFPPHMWMVGCM